MTVLGIEQLELLPDATRTPLLTEKQEDQWFDRKSPRVDARGVGDAMIALANADGGVLVIGIQDGVVEGVDAQGIAKQNEWRQAAINYTDPPVRHRFESVSCLNVRGLADHLVVIEVQVGERVHRNVRGEVFLRIGDENRKLSPTQIQELEFDRGHAGFDATVVQEATMSDLDPALVAHYIDAVRGSAPRRPEGVLEARGLVGSSKNGVRRPTVAGVLVLGTNPQRFLPEASVRLLRYRGSSRETGARSNVMRDVRLDGPLPLQVDRARRTLGRLLPLVMRFGDEAGRFTPAPLIPEPAWLEALVNAVVHRSYSLGGDHIRVEVFSDRLEVQSPGRLPGLVRVENIRSTRFARNPRIARAMADLNYGRELGEGVDRMFEEMERAGFPPPIFTEGSTALRVTFLFESVFRRMFAELPIGSERFVEHLSRAGRVTTTEAMDLLGMSRPTTLNWLRALASAKLLRHVGTSLKDPRGYWQPISAAVAPHVVRGRLRQRRARPATRSDHASERR